MSLQITRRETRWITSAVQLNNVECRGWDSDQTTEFTRQRDKLLTALAGLDADVIGLNELENSTGVEPLASIASGLPGYAYINTGTIGTDAIKVGHDLQTCGRYAGWLVPDSRFDR